MVEPFLPEHAVTQPQPNGTKRSGTKTLGLWLLLIAMLFGVWHVFASGRPDDTTLTALTAEKTTDYSGWAAAFGTLFLLSIALMAWFARTYLVSRNLHQLLEAPNRAYALGRYSEAVLILRKLHESTRRGDRTFIESLLARALVRSGAFAEARSLYVELERNGNILHTGVLRTLAASNLAFIYALSGDTAPAHKWLQEAWTRLAKVSDGEREKAGSIVHWAKAIVLVREGDVDGALSLLDSTWQDLRGTLTAREFVALEVLRGFAQSQKGLRAHVDHQSFEAKSDAEWLGTEWPEMRTFLQTLV